MAAPLPEDSWRTRHNTLKTAINSLCVWARIPAHCEVFGLFSYLIPAETLSKQEALERGRKRQGLLPDFKLDLSNPVGGNYCSTRGVKSSGCCSD